MRIAIVITCLASACSDAHCDRDQIYTHGLCIEPPTQDAPAVNGDAPFAHYGDACVDPGLCGAPTDFCFVSPGSDTGYCTRAGCTVDPDCPTGWQCTDLSKYLPGQPPVCTKVAD